MRVLFVSAHVAKGGGLALQMFRLFELVRERADARWVCLDAAGPHRDLQRRPGVETVGPLTFPTGVLALRDAIRERRGSFDLVQAVDPYYAMPAAFLAHASPRVVHFGTDPVAEIGWRYGPLASAALRASLPTLLDGASLVVNAPSLGARYRRFRPRVIPNGVDLARFEGLPGRGESRRRLGLPPEDPLLLFVGKVIPVKRLEWLFRVVADVPDARAVVVGGYDEEHYGDAYARRLRATFPDAADRVTFVGEVAWEGVGSYLAASDVFVFPSRFEGMPNAVLEAMAAGLPVVASDIPAHRDVIEDGETGFLAADAASMARAVGRLMREEPLRRAMGSAASERVRSRWSFDHCRDAYLALYESLAV